MSELLLEATRGDLVETVVRGHLAAVDSSGRLLAYCGDPEIVTFMRSAAKPLQATVLIESGAADRFSIEGPLLAICCSSHHGEPGHVAAISRVLDLAGLRPDALQCGPQPPLHRPSAAALLASGEQPTALHHVCAGNHAALLAVCQILKADTATYLNLDHPVQQLLLRTISSITGVAAEHITVGIDDCSAPAHGIPLSGIARAFAALARPESSPAHAEALARVTRTIVAHPWFVSGSNSYELSFMRRGHGRLLVKSGADGLLCVSVLDAGVGLAIKLEGGHSTRSHAVAIEALRQLGLLSPQDVEEMGDLVRPRLLNQRQVVIGEARSVFVLHRLQGSRANV